MPARWRKASGEKQDDFGLLAVGAASTTLMVMPSVVIVHSLELLHSVSHSKPTQTCPV